MSNGSIDDRIKILEEKFERTSTGPTKTDGPFQAQGGVGLGSPRMGSGRRRPPMSFSSREIPAFPPKTPHAIEQERRFKEVCKVSGKLNVGGVEYRSDPEDLQHLGELGSGTCGQVFKMLHKPSGAIIAVKQMRRSSNLEETKRILMDLDIVVRSASCPYIVRCFGCFVTSAEVWICMELMASCFDKLLRRLRAPIPEHILGKVTVATVKALSYLKNEHGVIHRDVKPSNILLDERGNVKLCDFGISGRLVDSKAKTRGAGCAAYMAPERIEPPDPSKPVYDIRADVWSLGISLVELATGVLPYKDCQNDFEVLTRVLKEDPPRLPEDSAFTPEFRSFVSQCLTKDVEKRPKYAQLLDHPFVAISARSRVSVGDWYATLAWGAQGTPTKAAPGGACAAHHAGGSSNGLDHYVTSAQHWIDQVTPLPQRAPWGMNASVASGSSSQPTSLEAEPTSLSPMLPRRRTIDEFATPPPPPRRPSAENRWRTASPSPGNTSPIVLQRFYHQKQQRRSRLDAHAAPRHRSLTREPSAGSPPPPPRTARHHTHLPPYDANGSAELEPPPLHERVHPHPPSPLLLSNRLSEGRSQSLTRAELPRTNGYRTHERHELAPPPAPPRQRHDDPNGPPPSPGRCRPPRSPRVHPRQDHLTSPNTT